MQWLIDIIKEWIIAQGYLTAGFVDRGDPAAADFDTGAFINDAAFHLLDLSTIVPENVKAVALTVEFRYAETGKAIQLRKNGNVNTAVRAIQRTQLANISIYGDFTVAVDDDRRIEYFLSTGTLQVCILTVKGWWF